MIDDRRSQLEMRWIPMTDEAGRVHMEMVWIVPTDPVGITQAA